MCPCSRSLVPAVLLVVIAVAVGYFAMPSSWFSRGETGDQFAETRGQPAGQPVPFDTKRAMGYLNDLCKIGPRQSATAGMTKQRELLEKHFTDLGGKVTWQKFEGRQRSVKEPIPMANMIVSWFPDRDKRVIFCGHYDTRPIADQEPERDDWFKPFVSANDGTSTAAWMMELAHHMKDLPVKVGVDFVLFDGEEYVFNTEEDRYFLGSEHFADQYAKQKKGTKYVAAVLLDLFAGKDARYPVEPNSKWFAAGLVDSVWGTAKELGVKSFVSRNGREVMDDHLALNKANIPAIDIIDFDYKHWHRLSDTPENVSPESMEQVARVLTVWVQKLK
jgi:hypothetical protein